MAGSQSALIKNLCLCYCDNKPEILEKTVNTVSHLLHAEHGNTYQDDIRLLDKIWKHFQKYGRNQEMLRFGQIYARINKLKVLKVRLETLQFLYALADTASTEHHHDSISRPMPTSSASSFDIPSFSLLSVQQGSSSMKENGLSHNSSHIKSSTSLQKLLHYNNDDETSSSSKSHLHSTMNKINEIDNSTSLQRDADESRLLRELLFGMQGIETPRLLANDSNIDRCTRTLITRFLECGWLYEKIRKIINTPTSSLVAQAFIANLSSELREYHRLISVIEQQENMPGMVSLKKLHVWMCTPIQRLKCLAAIADSCHGKKGGQLLSILYMHSQHGDPLQQSILYPLLYNCTIPIRDMIVEWICNGIINDPYQEFFVSTDKMIGEEKLWYDKYTLRVPMVPTFLSMEQAKKIWITGKSINFLRVVCKDRTMLQINKTPASSQSLFQQQRSTEFQDMIISIYNETTRYLRSILDDKYQMMDHFKAIKRYLLLGQGDFIKYLMDLMENELNKPANQVFYHNLQSLMDAAIRVTNAQYESEDIIRRLDLRLMYVSPSELGWDVCCLDYKFDGPLRTIFTEENSLRYMRIFNHLWRVKRMEYTTCGVWKQLMKSSREFAAIPEISDMVHTCFTMSNEMTKFVQSVNYYIMFEVLECSWSDLLNKLMDAKDLEQILEAHDDSLLKILTRLHLDGHETSQELAKQLRCIFDLILNFGSIIQRLIQCVDNEIQARKPYQQQQHHGTYTKNVEPDAEIRRFHTILKPQLKTIKSDLHIVKKAFRDAVLKFLQQLKFHPDITLRSLSFRLNFNEFYKVSYTSKSTA
ncbi:unnamed protein product [Rotaria socialis]|uniref:Gamma-tubulin complex component n=1 Tax=Rotaria socialis TaxID=392032 RepID=A0A821KXJ1_9BILA|nr:unnamed protein product [Rotaria socialis]CAF3326515.1 unnamed protein product [Rotaria socialis]CAF3618152.1 unnamed protein product [Rotaria socialis]CAF3638240.1 unnamed protein product [Rotaria socialis]CAF4342042.1 unnamed protein product [Rotaria socialis]